MYSLGLATIRTFGLTTVGSSRLTTVWAFGLITMRSFRLMWLFRQGWVDWVRRYVLGRIERCRIVVSWMNW
jgi:hypothetical protein